MVNNDFIRRNHRRVYTLLEGESKMVENKLDEWDGEDAEQLKEQELKKLKDEMSTATEQEPEDFDPKPYLGKTAKIESWEPLKGKFGESVLVKTAVIEEKRGIRATKILQVIRNSVGKLCWFKGLNKTAIFMNDHNAKTFDELIGKEVFLQSQTSKKDGKKYLTFD